MVGLFLRFVSRNTFFYPFNLSTSERQQHTSTSELRVFAPLNPLVNLLLPLAPLSSHTGLLPISNHFSNQQHVKRPHVEIHAETSARHARARMKVRPKHEMASLCRRTWGLLPCRGDTTPLVLSLSISVSSLCLPYTTTIILPHRMYHC
jgi:hypothetical protein